MPNLHLSDTLPALPGTGPLAKPGRSHLNLSGRMNDAMYWLRLPWHWLRQVVRNTHDILRVWRILKIRPLPAGLVGLDHPWVTGISPITNRPIWLDNVIYRSKPDRNRRDLAEDQTVLMANGRFLTARVRQSAVMPEIPLGPQRRMPHAINYMHGSSHYNSGLILLDDLQDAYRHINDPRFRREVKRFVALERREVLFLFRSRDYDAREYAYLSCCMRSQFSWFCNPNGPQDRVLWGNAAPFPAANLITGHWADDVFALGRPGGEGQVVRDPIPKERYFQNGSFGQGRNHAIWPEKLLAWGNYFRVKIRRPERGIVFRGSPQELSRPNRKTPVARTGRRSTRPVLRTPMFDAQVRRLIDPPLDALARVLCKAGLSANAITLGGFVAGMAGCAAIAFEHYTLALVLIGLNRLADGLDGCMARQTGCTDVGGYLDIVLDTIFYSGVPFAFALARPEAALPAAFLIYSFVGTGGSFLAYAVIAAKRGVTADRLQKKSFFYSVGLMEGSETVIFMLLSCLWPNRFATLAWIFGGLCWLTTIIRIAMGIFVFRHSPGDLE